MSGLLRGSGGFFTHGRMGFSMGFSVKMGISMGFP
jgi:hypothetical protein